MSRMNKKTKERFKRIINNIGELAFLYFYKNVHKMSYEKIMKKARFFSSIYYIIDKKRVNIAKRNIKLAFGDKYSEKETNDLIRAVLDNFIFEGLMFFYLAEKDLDFIKDIVTVEGIEHIYTALEKGCGCILLTAHYGNWEILARCLCADGLKINVIARDSDNIDMTKITNNIRNNGGYSVYSRNKPLLGIIRALKRNECLGILPDQHDYEGIVSNFFGHEARTSVGCATFSLRTGAPIVPLFCYREDLGHYKLIVYPPIEFETTDDLQTDKERLTQIVNDKIEDQIRLEPRNWLWIHNRWK